MPGRMTGRFGAALRGEQPVEPLLAYRRAGGPAHEWMQQERMWWAGLTVSGVDPWTTSAPDSARLLCAWNAYVPQLVGEQLLEAEARAGTNRAGYLPAVSAEQALRLFRAVEPWLARVARAVDDPAYRVDLEVRLPAGLPPWVEVEPCPSTHLEAMLAATRQLRALVHANLGSLRDLPVTSRQQAAYKQLAAVADSAEAAADYAERLLHPGASAQVHADIEARLKFALERQYHVGQLCALPALLAGYLQPPSWGPPAHAGGWGNAW